MPEPIVLIFLIDLNGLVYVYGRGGLAIGGAGEVLDLVREAFSVEEEAVDLKKEPKKRITEKKKISERQTIAARPTGT